MSVKIMSATRQPVCEAPAMKIISQYLFTLKIGFCYLYITSNNFALGLVSFLHTMAQVHPCDINIFHLYNLCFHL